MNSLLNLYRILLAVFPGARGRVVRYRSRNARGFKYIQKDRTSLTMIQNDFVLNGRMRKICLRIFFLLIVVTRLSRIIPVRIYIWMSSLYSGGSLPGLIRHYYTCWIRQQWPNTRWRGLTDCFGAPNEVLKWTNTTVRRVGHGSCQRSSQSSIS